MRISGVTLQTVAPPERRQFRYRGGVILPYRVLVSVHSDTGLVGTGEATPIPTDWGHGVESIYYTILAYIAPTIIGMDPFDFEGIWASVARGVSIDQVPHSMLVERAGVDAALYDLCGKAARVPVHALLGGRTAERLPVAAVIGLDTPSAMAHRAVETLALGYTDFKVKVGVDAETDVQRVAALRAALGATPTIRVDANGGWTPNEAIRVIRKMERYNLELVEQPVPGWDFDGLVRVRQSVDSPIMVDESLHSIHDALLLASRGCCDLFNIKIQRLGGITPSRKVIHIAEAAGIDCMLGGELETGVGTAAGLHLYASSFAFTIPADLVGPDHFSDDVIVNKFSVSDGSLSVPNGPGLGVDLDEAKLSQYAVPMRSLEEMARAVAPPLA